MYGALSQLPNCWDLDKQEQRGVEDALKLSIGVAMHATRVGTLFIEKGGFSLCNTAALKFYYKSNWVL